MSFSIRHHRKTAENPILLKMQKLDFFYLHISSVFCYFSCFVFHFLRFRRVFHFDPLLSSFFWAMLNYWNNRSPTDYMCSKMAQRWLKDGHQTAYFLSKIWAKTDNFVAKWKYKLSTVLVQSRKTKTLRILQNHHTNGGNNRTGTYFSKF